MFHFGRASLARLATCDPMIQKVMNEAIKTSSFDFTIVCGHRSQEEQEKCFKNKTSYAHWPDSPHNTIPSSAVDVVPFVNGKAIWDDNDSHYILLALHIESVAKKMNVQIKWGGNWKTDVTLPCSVIRSGKPFRDKPHWELVHRNPKPHSCAVKS